MNYSNWIKFSAISILYLILGVVFTWPLLPNLGTQIPNNLYSQADHTYVYGDQLQVYAGFIEHKNMLSNSILGNPIYEKEFCFHLEVENCEASTYYKIKNIIFSPYWIHTLLNVLFDGPVVYNLVILFSYLTTGLAGFFLARKFNKTKSKFIVPFAISLFPVLAQFSLHHILVGHRNGWLIFLWIIMVLLVEVVLVKGQKEKANRVNFVEILLGGRLVLHSSKSEERRKGLFSEFAKKIMLKLGLILILVFFSFTEKFFLFYGLLLIAFRILWQEVPIFASKIKNERNFKNWIEYSIQTVFEHGWSVFALVLVYFINEWGILSSISSSNMSNGRPLELIAQLSPEFSQLFTNGILEHEHNIYLGVGSAVLGFGILLSILIILSYLTTKLNLRKYIKKPDSRLIFYTLISILFLTISLGTNTPLYQFLYENIPTFNFSRTPARAIQFIFVFLIPISAIILNNVKKSSQIWIAIVLGTSIGLTSHTMQLISLAGLPPVEENLPENSKILFVPVKEPGHFYNSLYEYQISTVNSVTLNGYHPFVTTEMAEFHEKYEERLNLDAEDGIVDDKTLVDQLKKEYGIDEIVVYGYE